MLVRSGVYVMMLRKLECCIPMEMTWCPLLSNTPSPSAQYVAVLGYDIVWALGIGHQLV